VRSRQISFEFEGETQSPVPLVYVACRLTNINPEQKKLLDSWCTHVEEAVTEAAEGSASRWDVRVHIPFTWSAPWTSERPPEEIYEFNSATVEDCSAVIILCIDGGGLGVGQEFAWAVALRLPILILHHRDLPLSRQAQGTPADVETVAFGSAVELSDAVRNFLRRNRSVIENWRRRSESLALSLLTLRETLSDLWRRLGDGDRTRVEAESRVHKNRVTQILERDFALAGASISEILALSGAMGINFFELLGSSPMPDLSERQRSSLGSAADEYEWQGSEVLSLETRARLELARGGTRRLSLVTPADWLNFREQVSGRG
jgi:hypothetical protein